MQYMEDGKLAQRFRVLLPSSSDVIEVFLVQHVAQPGEGGEAGQADAWPLSTSYPPDEPIGCDLWCWRCHQTKTHAQDTNG